MICKKSFRQLLLMILSLITLMSGAGCGTEKKTEAIENQNVKGEFIPPDIRNGVYKKTASVEPVWDFYIINDEVYYMSDTGIKCFGKEEILTEDSEIEKVLSENEVLICKDEKDVLNYYVRRLDDNSEKKIFTDRDYKYINSYIIGNSIFVVNSDGIIVISDGGSYEAKTEALIKTACISGNGRLLIEVDDEKNDEGEILEFSEEKRDFSRICKIPSTSILVDGNAGGLFYFSLEDGLYSYSDSENEAHIVMEYLTSDINPDQMMDIKLSNDGKIYVLNSENMSLTEYSWADKSDINVTELTLAVFNPNMNLQNDVIDFNTSQSDYHITVLDYGKEADPEAKFSVDVAAGKFPDLYDITYSFGDNDINSFVKKGMLERLDTYLEKDDAISRDDMVPALYNSMLVDDGLYYVTPYFFMDALMGKASEVGNDRGWTVQELADYIESKPDSVPFFSVKGKSSGLVALLEGCREDYLDWNNGTCSFDSEDFIRLLECSNRCISGEEAGLDGSEAELMKSGRILFLREFLRPDDIHNAIKVLEGDLCIKGFPAKTNKGVVCEPVSAYAISSESKNKEGAWRFISWIMSSDYQGKNYTNGGIPLRTDVYNEYLKYYQASEDYKDAFGNDIHVEISGCSFAGVMCQNEPVSDEEIEVFKALTNDVSDVTFTNPVIKSIIVEEAEKYYQGDRSAEDAAAIIQNRVSNYMSELK